ncbi:RNA/RNP complex-1-interacting phosphatase [Exaiptasia diaphana]|uniref:RNA/RNP complex-1-interacting phosphatase n=1 Tax=Exaiptasia diaphana TaxID=2652724 RepID=A0A913WSD4_EXADI|nr:RNA/RNP complex-1-interacting phosphatase [Exaiptasia diaphana]KXJ18401.1 RNA/RNP complex-1-interacting phosphatase [Exaiptasia diaphana]
MAKRVPDRWREYDPCKWIPIKDERIIAFKTPLSKKFDHEQPDDDGILESERFTPTDLVDGLAEKGFCLGLVVDFTFTKRYYDPQEFKKKGILYNKMMCPGHKIPDEKDVKRFEYEVHSFLEKNKNGSIVGVHCTHGVNRTGYMVCRYLIDCRGYQPDDAIKAFHESRGYPVERENYLEDLKSRTPGQGVNFEPGIEDQACDNERTNGRQSVWERIDLPPRRQRNFNPRSSRDYESVGRSSTYHHDSSWRDRQYRFSNDRSHQRPSSGSFHNRAPSHNFDMPPWSPYGHRNSYYDNGPRDNCYYDNRLGDNSLRDSYYDDSFRDSNYGNRSSYQRDYGHYNQRGFDNDYSSDYMSRNTGQYPRNIRYQPYSEEGRHINRQWQR